MPPRREPTPLEIARCMDFSTEPCQISPPPKYLVSDVSRTITKWSMQNGLLTLYRRFPLHEIVELLLSCSVEDTESPGYWSMIQCGTEERLGDIDFMAADDLWMIYEAIACDLDFEIAAKSPNYYRSNRYVFYQWWDPVSICLIEEKSSPFIDVGKPTESSRRPYD